MVDVAALGIRVDSQSAGKAAGDLKNLSQSAKQAERDVINLNAAASRSAQAMANAARAQQQHAAVTRLSANEARLLGFQLNDIATGLLSGQSPFMIATQQGGQLYQVLAGSQGGITGALRGVGSSLSGLVTVGRLAFGGVIAGATAAAFALNDFLDKQRTAERALIGAGRRSGATAADINQIGSAGASATGFSVSEARDVALEFARTGKIHKSVITEMIDTTKNFATITGQSGKEAAEALAKSFSDMKGIDALNERFHFLGAAARQSIEDLLAQGNSTEAAAQANQRLAERLKEVEGTVSSAEKGWRALTNSLSNYWTALGEILARQLDLQRLDPSEQVAKLEANLERVRKIREDLANRGRSTESADNAIERITKEIEALNAARQKNAQNNDFTKLELDAARAVGAMNPLVGKIREQENALKLLQAAYEQGAVVPGLSEEINLRNQIIDKLKLQQQAQDALLQKYPGMTLEFAKQLESLEQQNRLLKARENGNEASVAAAIAYEDAISRGATHTEAAAIQALTLKNNLLGAAKAADDIDVNLQPDLGDDTSASGGSFTGNETFGNKKFEGILSNAGFAFAQAVNRAASSQEVITGALSGGVNSALASLSATQFQSTLRNPFGQPFEINSARSGFGTQADITTAINQLYELKLAQAGDDTAAKRAVYEDQLAFLMTQPMTIQNQLDIANLQNTMRNLTDAVEANTAAQVTLNPFYTQGHGALPQFGFYHAANGLDLTAYGPSSGDQIPFSAMVNGGENIKITPAGASNDNSKTINNYITNNFGGGVGSEKRRSLRQFVAGYDQAMAAVG